MSDFLTTLPEDVAKRLAERVNQMMAPGGQYDPFTGDNLAEALLEAKDEQFAKLAAHLRSGDIVATNAALLLIVREYWFDYGCRVEEHLIVEEIAQEEFDGPDILGKPESWERLDLPGLLRKQAGGHAIIK